ncbi:uncharacterized protein LOC132309409 [Cornus florida]|uniref:uncharacterized protein LOC132309409 n=1 Tax=Cornus florida TaxID=4283 RepID=UPI0028A132AF|nr:uncharacterized protein LOC132309409 [Cornus florida]
MALNTENDSLMCKCFSTSLAGPALNWFKNLPKGSIDSFRSLCDRFISQYYGNKRPAKDISNLFTMKQHEDERLQAFLTRFNLTKSMVIECHLSTAVQAFKLAITRGTPFHISLVVNTPKTMDELNERADGFVCLEEEEPANARKTSIISIEKKTKAKIRQKQVQPQRQTSGKFEKRPKEEELELKETSRGADSQRGVRELYSRPSGRTELTMEQVKRNQKSSSHNSQPIRIINAIHGRPEPSEESDELLRTRLRQAQMKKKIGNVNALHQQSVSTQIKFDKTDLLRIQIPYENPLVVSLTVAKCLVRRILINPGSSANVMPRDTFDWLEIKPEKLKPTGNPLLGFDGKRVEPIGMLEVEIQAAERVLTENFVVVEIHPSYNLLMGRGWIHRVQVVQKNNGKWRVCIDFTNLNKAYPKDSFPLLKIDQMVDATTGYERLPFLDAYSGYNQILMNPADEEKISFVTERGTYCYKVMPFGLKNAGATYQRLISKIFKDQMGKTV